MKKYITTKRILAITGKNSLTEHTSDEFYTIRKGSKTFYCDNVNLHGDKCKYRVYAYEDPNGKTIQL